MGLVDVDLQGIGEVLGSVGGFAKDIRSALTGEIGPEKRATLEAKTLEMQTALAIAQTKINTEEAKSKSTFVAGWRPFCGWVCGGGIAYKFIVHPILEFIVRLCGYTGAVPEISVVELIPILVGMLGLAAHRSYEKKHGINRRH